MPWFRTEAERVADELEKLHDEYLRLLRQLEAHAGMAPYARVADPLTEIRRAEERSARAIAERLIALGRQPEGNDHGPVRGGNSSWQRLIVTLEDYRALLRQLSQLWVRWDDEHREDAALVRSLVETATRSRNSLVDLVARSDPHAVD